MLVPEITVNLMSVKALTKDGINIHFTNQEAILSKCDKIVAKVTSRGNLYYLDALPPHQSALSVTLHPDTKLWHSRFSHLGIRNLMLVPKITKGMEKLNLK